MVKDKKILIQMSKLICAKEKKKYKMIQAGISYLKVK